MSELPSEHPLVNKGLFLKRFNLGRSRTESCLTDATGTVLRRSSCNSRDLLGSPDVIQEALHQHIVGLMDEWKTANNECFGIAVTAPGSVRVARHAGAARDRRHASPYAWDDLCGVLSDRLGCPVFAENDANAMALGEHWFGCGRECDHFALHTIGEGIGADAIIDGMLYRGNNDVVGEVGHTTVNLNGSRCACDNTGCLELYAGFRTLREACLGARRSRRKGSYRDDLTDLFAAYATGEPRIVSLVEERARVVAVGMVSLANMFGPEKIIVASYDGAAIDLDPFVAEMRSAVKAKVFSAIGRDVAVFLSPAASAAENSRSAECGVAVRGS